MGPSSGIDIPMWADFENDSDTEFVFYRSSSDPSYQSNFVAFGSSFQQIVFGLNIDDPTVIGDYTGDGKADVAVFRCNPNAAVGSQCYWIYRASEIGLHYWVPWGTVYAAGRADIAAPGDYDGDGKHDFAVRRLSNPTDPNNQAIFYILRSSDGAAEYHAFGIGTDRFVKGDFDGDGKTDLCAVRNSQIQGAQMNWFIRYSSSGNYASFIPWGLGKSGAVGDYIAPGDYNGDGRTDIAVWRRTAINERTIFYVLPSTAAQGVFGSVMYEAVNACSPGPCEYPVAQFLVH
jgi:spore coat protein A, manganese oxidase